MSILLTAVILILSNIITDLAGLTYQTDDQPSNISSQVWSNPALINEFIDLNMIPNPNKHHISYNIPYNKFLIGTIELKNYSENNPQYKVSHPMIKLDDFYYHNFTEVNGQKGFEFYLSEDEVFSPIDYYTHTWERKDSEYVTFHFLKDKAIAEEAMQILDARIEDFFSYFPEKNNELDSLRINKLDYFYCPDLATIEKLTSYQTRGILFLNQDYVLSTYPAHFHEVTHFLINYYLKNNELYTHPFLQEGLAVAIGGRGGHSTNSLMETGKFLIDTGMVDYSDFYNVELFRAEHSSISYPVAGLLTRIMLEHYSPEDFLSLYKKYSNPTGVFPIIDDLEWLTDDAIQEYIKDSTFRTVFFKADENNFKETYRSQRLVISESNNLLQFKSIANVNFDIINKEYSENEAGRYSLTCSQDEVKLVDNLLDEVISSWSVNFTLSDERIPYNNGYYQFFLLKEHFQSDEI